MLGDIFEGAVRFGASYIGGKKRLARREEAQSAYDASMADYFSQDTSNLYSGLENVYEDLTVNQQAAQFQAQQQQQGMANTMEALRAGAGGSGIAALAQSLAQQQAANAQAASASIGMQESNIQGLQAGEASRLQIYERKGAEQSRALQSQLLGEQFMIDAGELASSEAAIQAAQAARTEAFGQFAGGVGNLANTLTFGDFSSILGNEKVNLPSKSTGSVSTSTSQGASGMPVTIYKR